VEYYTQKIEIQINKDDPLYKRLVEKAARDNTTVKNVVDTLVLVGLYHDMTRKLDLLESMEARKK
jgi:hypothetical protein